MSSRAMRKLQKDKDQILIPGLTLENESNGHQHGAKKLTDCCENTNEDQNQNDATYEIKKKTQKKNISKFNALILLNDDDDDEEESNKNLSDGENGSPLYQENDETAENSEYIGTGAKKKKKKKNKNKKKGVSENEKEDDIEAVIQRVKDEFGDIGECRSHKETKTESAELRSLLNVEHRNLNPDNEMRRIFGSKVVGAEQSRRPKNRSRVFHRTTWLTQPKDTWPAMGKIGIIMEKRETLGGCDYFAITHTQMYQQVQFKFLDAVESLNPENIVAILNIQPFHIDSLIQLSEVCRASQDNQMAAELIERALYAFECNFHPLFNIVRGNCRLDYRVQENRGFFLVLLRHAITIGNKGCYRTALEYCKLLLSLDPVGDPLGVLLMLDFYALRAEQYSYLTRVCTDWEARRNLSQLPNFAYSYPLALFHAARKEGGDVSLANEKLQYALMMFPMVLLPLLEKCSVTPDTEVVSHLLFALQNQYSVPDGLRMLCALYVERCFTCWKEPEVMEWLEGNVREVVHRITDTNPLLREYSDKRSVRYKGCPHNIYRHLLISDLKGAKVTLPPHLSQTSILSYDPLPPADSIVAYQRPPKPPRYGQDAGVLSMFVRSLLPNFDLQTPQGPTQAAPDDVAVAEGGDDTIDRMNDLRHNVGTLMAAMRDFLSNIQPAAPPVENGGDEENGEDGWD